MGIDRVMTGRMSACTGLAPITGTRPRRNEKIWMRMMPIQNTGSETKKGGRPRKKRRSQVPRPYVAVKAMTTPRKIARPRPSTARVRVAGSAVAMRSETAAPLATE